MKYKQENNTIKSYSISQIKDIQEIKYATTQQFEEKGYFDKVTPVYDKLTHKLGDVFFDATNKIFTYNLVSLSQEEKEQALIDQEKLIYKQEAEKYPQRRVDGQRFSDMQGAKLILLEAPENIKKEISNFFAESQGFLVQGWWKSALRDLQEKQPTPYVSIEILSDIIQYIETYIEQSYV